MSISVSSRTGECRNNSLIVSEMHSRDSPDAQMKRSSSKQLKDVSDTLVLTSWQADASGEARTSHLATSSAPFIALSIQRAASSFKPKEGNGATKADASKSSNSRYSLLPMLNQPANKSSSNGVANGFSVSRSREAVDTRAKENIINGRPILLKKQSSIPQKPSAVLPSKGVKQLLNVKTGSYKLQLSVATDTKKEPASSNKDHESPPKIDIDNIISPSLGLTDPSAELPVTMNGQLDGIGCDIEMEHLDALLSSSIQPPLELKNDADARAITPLVSSVEAPSPIGFLRRPQLSSELSKNEFQMLIQMDDPRLPSDKAKNIIRLTPSSSNASGFGAGVLSIDLSLMLRLAQEKKRKHTEEMDSDATKAQRLSKHVDVSSSLPENRSTNAKDDQQELGALSLVDVIAPMNANQTHVKGHPNEMCSLNVSPIPSLTPDAVEADSCSVENSPSSSVNGNNKKQPKEKKPKIGDRHQVSILPQVLPEEEKETDAMRFNEQQIVYHEFKWSSESLDLVPDFTPTHEKDFSPSPPSPLLQDSESDSNSDFDSESVPQKSTTAAASQLDIKCNRSSNRLLIQSKSSGDRYKVNTIVCKRLTEAVSKKLQRKSPSFGQLSRKDFEYLVQWDGYSIADDTWEPYAHIEDYYVGNHYDRNQRDFPMESEYDQLNPKYKQAKALAIAQRQQRNERKEAAKQESESKKQKTAKRRKSHASASAAAAASSSSYRETDTLRMPQQEVQRVTDADIQYFEASDSKKEVEEDEPTFMLYKTAPITPGSVAAAAPTNAPAISSESAAAASSISASIPAAHHHHSAQLSPPMVDELANESFISSSHVDIIEIDTDEEEESDNKMKEANAPSDALPATEKPIIKEVFTTASSLSQAEPENRPYQFGTITRFATAADMAAFKSSAFHSEVITIEDD